jgi:hypothetical protein
MLSGAMGHVYGSADIWPFSDGWKDHLDTPSATQIGYLVKLFARWFRLVPDQTHKVVTAGYGTFAPDAKVNSSNYVTTASTPDGRLAVSFLPAGGTIVVDMTRLCRPRASTVVRPHERHLSTGARHAVQEHGQGQADGAREERRRRARLGARAERIARGASPPGR